MNKKKQKHESQPISPKDKQHLIHQHLNQRRRASSILTKIKRNSRVIDESHLKDIQALQQTLNNHFYYEMLKFSKVSEESESESSCQSEKEEVKFNANEEQDRKIKKKQKIFEQQKSNKTEDQNKNEIGKYKKLLDNAQQLTQRLMIHRIQNDNIPSIMSKHFQKQRKLTSGCNASEDISPFEPFNNLIKRYQNLQIPPKKIIQKKNLRPRNTLDIKYDNIFKKIQDVGLQMKEDYQSKVFSGLHLSSNSSACKINTITSTYLNSGDSQNQSTKTIQQPFVFLSRHIKRRSNIVFPSVSSSESQVFTKNNQNLSQTFSSKQCRLNLSSSRQFHKNQAFQPLQVQQRQNVNSPHKIPRRIRKGILLGDPKKLAPGKQRERLFKKIGNFVKFTSDVQNIMGTNNCKLQDLIEQMQNINKADYAQLQDQNFQVELKQVEDIRFNKYLKRRKN